MGDAAGEGAIIYYASDVGTALLPGHTVCADEAEDRYVNTIDIAKVLAPEDPATQAACAGSTVPGAPPAQAVLTAECLNAALKEAGLQGQELMHPNANGHRAITNSLVDWSNRSDVVKAWAEDKDRSLDTSGFVRGRSPSVRRWSPAATRST